jgi:hypothetical protein
VTERAYGTSAFFLAALVAGAGAIHFAMGPIHASDSLTDGILFALTGWFQISLAIALAVRPNRGVLIATIVSSIVFMGAWALSRTAGLPWGSHAGVAEDVGSIDLLAVVFEGLAALGATYLLVRKPAGYTFRFRPAMLAAAALPALLVMGATTAVVASPDAMGHSGGSHTEAAAGGTSHGDGHGDSHGGGTGASSDTGGHGHSGPAPWQNITDEATRDELSAQLQEARDVAARYPTAADAAEAGYVRVTPYVPLIGAHWMNFSLVDGEFDPSQPEMLLYDESGLDAEMVGLSYYVASGDELPDGFAGPNDEWHAHLGLCIGASGVIGPESLTEAECAEIGGEKADGGGRYMVHAWVVPGWESPWGIFSGEHPDLT